MTVAASKAISPVYRGDGVQDTFAFGFKIYKNDDIIVSVNDGTAVFELDASLYSVSINTDTDGGSITSNDPLAVDYLLVVTRSPKLEQLIAITGGAFHPEVIMKMVDLLTFQTQYLDERISRFIIADPTIDPTPEALLEQLNAAAIATALDAAATEEDRTAAEAAINTITGLVATHNAAADPHSGKFAAASHEHALQEYGMILSNNVINPTTDIDISTGRIFDSTFSQAVLLDAILTKKFNATWADGNNTGGMANGIVLSPDTWYPIFALIKPDGAINVGGDISLVATNLLADAAVVAAGYTKYRRLGRVLTDGSSNIIPGIWIPVGTNTSLFVWDSPISDHASIALHNTRISRVMSAPLGAKQQIIFNITSRGVGSFDNFLLVTDPDQADVVPTETICSHISYAVGGVQSALLASQITAVTNNNSEIAIRTSAADAGTYNLTMIAYYDNR